MLPEQFKRQNIATDFVLLLHWAPATQFAAALTFSGSEFER